MQSKITNIVSREILDSRGNPTIETTVFCGKLSATASVPSGASTGSHEALELRDGSLKRYHGLGVKKAIANVQKKILPKLKGKNVLEQNRLDELMIALDGTPNKRRLGANAILSVSLATARLAALISGKELYEYLATLCQNKHFRIPQPLFNVINGGVHADSGLDIQEFFLIPLKGSMSDRLQSVHSVIFALKAALKKKRLSVGLGDEGGFAPKLGGNEKALRLLMSAIKTAGLKPGKDMALGIDAAATEFFDGKKETYRLLADRKHYKPASMFRLYKRWSTYYPLIIVEDGCAEDDFLGWQSLTVQLGHSVTLVGDDLFVTDPKRIQSGIISGIANAALIKPNQIGTLTETITAIKTAQKYNYKTIISHRSGETMDDFIADLSVAVGADYIKAGSLARGERIAKYNRLLAIEAKLHKK